MQDDDDEDECSYVPTVGRSFFLTNFLKCFCMWRVYVYARPENFNLIFFLPSIFWTSINKKTARKWVLFIIINMPQIYECVCVFVLYIVSSVPVHQLIVNIIREEGGLRICFKIWRKITEICFKILRQNWTEICVFYWNLCSVSGRKSTKICIRSLDENLLKFVFDYWTKIY